jgi:hypothetical protein
MSTVGGRSSVVLRRFRGTREWQEVGAIAEVGEGDDFLQKCMDIGLHATIDSYRHKKSVALFYSSVQRLGMKMAATVFTWACFRYSRVSLLLLLLLQQSQGLCNVPT